MTEHRPGDGCGELLWEHMSADPSFNEDMRQAEAELAEGRGVPFREVARTEQDEAVRLWTVLIDDYGDDDEGSARGSVFITDDPKASQRPIAQGLEWKQASDIVAAHNAALATPPPVPADLEDRLAMGIASVRAQEPSPPRTKMCPDPSVHQQDAIPPPAAPALDVEAMAEAICDDKHSFHMHTGKDWRLCPLWDQHKALAIFILARLIARLLRAEEAAR